MLSISTPKIMYEQAVSNHAHLMKGVAHAALVHPCYECFFTRLSPLLEIDPRSLALWAGNLTSLALNVCGLVLTSAALVQSGHDVAAARPNDPGQAPGTHFGGFPPHNTSFGS